MSKLRVQRAGRTAVDMVIFLLGLGFALLQDWEIRELIWGLWLSSLLVGYATVILATSALALGKTELPPSTFVPRTTAGQVLLVLGTLVFFSVHFGGFHLGHAIFVHHFFPLTEDRSWLQVPIYLAGLLPFVGMMALGERDRLKQATEEFEFRGAYANVMRMHLLIFFFAFAEIQELEAHIVFVVIYIVYFAPFRWR